MIALGIFLLFLGLVFVAASVVDRREGNYRMGRSSLTIGIFFIVVGFYSFGIFG